MRKQLLKCCAADRLTFEVFFSKPNVREYRGAYRGRFDLLVNSAAIFLENASLGAVRREPPSSQSGECNSQSRGRAKHHVSARPEAFQRPVRRRCRSEFYATAIAANPPKTGLTDPGYGEDRQVRLSARGYWGANLPPAVLVAFLANPGILLAR